MRKKEYDELIYNMSTKHMDTLDKMATRHLEAERQLLKTINDQELEITWLRANQKSHIEQCVDNYECREMED